MPDYKLSLSPELDEQLRKIARENDLDINQLLLNAISLYKNLKDNTSENNTSIGILDANNVAIKKVIIP